MGYELDDWSRNNIDDHGREKDSSDVVVPKRNSVNILALPERNSFQVSVDQNQNDSSVEILSKECLDDST
jgi:hypothetical protein